jgi:hypothetical protein
MGSERGRRASSRRARGPITRCPAPTVLLVPIIGLQVFGFGGAGAQSSAPRLRR